MVKYIPAEEREVSVYFNSGNEGFVISRNSSVYVDMSGMISLLNSRINTEKRYVCLTRPRRFGKSMTANMLNAFYDCSCDSSSLFEDLQIAKEPSYESHRNRYNTIFLDIASFGMVDGGIKETLRIMIRALLTDIYREMEIIDREKQLRYTWEEISNASGDVLCSTLQDVAVWTQRKFIFIIDEWDYLFRTYPDDHKGHMYFQHWLSQLLKGRSYAALVYMTGILPLQTYGSVSILNMFDEYSMVNMREFAPYTGFLEEQVKELCLTFDMSFDVMKNWYDGYMVEDCFVYNPNSVVCALDSHSFLSYWTQSSTFRDVRDYLILNYDGLKEKVQALLAGNRVEVRMNRYTYNLTDFDNADSVLAALVHLGYLTYTSVDSFDKNIGYAWIPNREVREQFELATQDESGYKNLFAVLKKSEQLLDATLRMDEKTVAEEIEQAHERYTSILKVNDENSLACVITNAYYTAVSKYTIYNEFPSGKGFADMVFVPHKSTGTPPIVVELKYDRDAKAAIDQIHSRNYAGKLLEGFEEVLLVGIGYDRDDRVKPYTCRIELFKLK